MRMEWKFSERKILQFLLDFYWTSRFRLDLEDLKKNVLLYFKTKALF